MPVMLVALSCQSEILQVIHCYKDSKVAWMPMLWPYVGLSLVDVLPIFFVLLSLPLQSFAVLIFSTVRCYSSNAGNIIMPIKNVATIA